MSSAYGITEITFKRSDSFYRVEGKKFYFCNSWCNNDKPNHMCNEEYYRNNSTDHQKTYERTEQLVCYLGPKGSPSVVFVVKSTFKGELPEAITKTSMKELYMAGFIQIAASLATNCNTIILSDEAFLSSDNLKDEAEKNVIKAYFPTLQSMHKYFDYIETQILGISEKEECAVRDARSATS
jgi:hypothetical protein